MIDVELLGAELAPEGPALAEVRSLCAAAAQSMEVVEGHLAVEYVGEARTAAFVASLPRPAESQVEPCSPK